jgi:xanthine dehydrogenase YagR molybdenum-binding subunit
MMQEQAQGKKKRKVKVTRVVEGIEREVEVEIDDDGSYPEWGKNNAHRLLNKRVTRVDAPVKVTGKAQYTYDVKVPGMLYGRILTAPHAHARVVKIDASVVGRMPGVKAVMIVPGEAAVEGAQKASAEADKKNPTEVGGKEIKKEREPGKVIRFEGEPIAAVAAVSPEIAEDAIRAFVVEYERLPHVVKASDAMNSASPKVYPEGNVEDKEKRGKLEQVQAEYAKCDAIYEAEFLTPIIHHACLETHGIVVDYRGGDTATVYASTQGTFTIPGDAAKELKLPESSVVAIVEHMGGGFGSKFGIGAEGKIACQLSKQSGVPVKMMLTRRQEFTSAGNRSGSWQRIKAGAMKDGTLVALEAVQHRHGGLGDGSQAGQPYIYKVANSHRDVKAIHTHEDASRAMRAPGHPQASFAMESTLTNSLTR